jgi:hypothetical protein
MAKRRCIRRGYKTILQDYGPAKKVRVCRKFGTGKAAAAAVGGRKRRRHHWCVFKGVRKHTCHLHKANARAAALHLQKKCKHKVTVRSVRRVRRRKK